MSISIIIVNWNSGQLLSECMKRLNSQTVLPDRVYIVDNDSNKQTELIPDSSQNLNVIRLSQNVGFAAGNNIVLSECNTQYVVLLNPDAFPEPKWLESLLKTAQEYPDIAAFGSKQLCYEDPNILDGIGDIYHVSGLVWRNRHGMRQTANDKIPREIFSPCAAAAMYNRQALMTVGYFDEDYFCYVEDVDLGFRLRLAGYKSMYVPSAVVHHVGSATTGGQHSNLSVYYGHRNLVWTFAKNMPGCLFWMLLPLHLLMNIATVVMFIFRGQYRIILKSKIDAVIGFRAMWRKRKHIHPYRVVSAIKILKILDFSLFPPKKF